MSALAIQIEAPSALTANYKCYHFYGHRDEHIKTLDFKAKIDLNPSAPTVSFVSSGTLKGSPVSIENVYLNAKFS